MTKRKRTYEEVMAMQEKAVRFQENLGHDEAAIYLEGLDPGEYASLRRIEIVDDPVQKRRRSKKRTEEPVHSSLSRTVRIMKGYLISK